MTEALTLSQKKRAYYERHRERILTKQRERYATDPVYRAQRQEEARLYYHEVFKASQERYQTRLEQDRKSQRKRSREKAQAAP